MDRWMVVLEAEKMAGAGTKSGNRSKTTRGRYSATRAAPKLRPAASRADGSTVDPFDIAPRSAAAGRSKNLPTAPERGGGGGRGDAPRRSHAAFTHHLRRPGTWARWGRCCCAPACGRPRRRPPASSFRPFASGRLVGASSQQQQQPPFSAEARPDDNGTAATYCPPCVCSRMICTYIEKISGPTRDGKDQNSTSWGMAVRVFGNPRPTHAAVGHLDVGWWRPGAVRVGYLNTSSYIRVEVTRN
jgi:hypothetical protein